METEMDENEEGYHGLNEPPIIGAALDTEYDIVKLEDLTHNSTMIKRGLKNEEEQDNKNNVDIKIEPLRYQCCDSDDIDSIAGKIKTEVKEEEGGLESKYLMMRAQFEQRLRKLMLEKKDRSLLLSDERYLEIVHETKEALQRKRDGLELSSKQYRRIKRYGLLTVGEKHKLVNKEHLGSPSSLIFYCAASEMYDVIHTTHLQIGHKRAKAMENELRKKYCNVTREVISIYLNLCELCALRKNAKSKGLMVKPISMSAMNSRCQVDLIDMQSEPDGEYKFILNYQDYLTKYVILRPLKTKTAEEVADVVLDIFCLFGAPYILHSDHGREFGNQVIEKLAASWPTIKLVHGKPRHSVEGANQDVLDSLVAWMSENKCRNWAKGLRFIQSTKNLSFHTGIKRTPYEAMFGHPQRNGLLDAGLPKSVVDTIETEEQLEEHLKSIKRSSDVANVIHNSEIGEKEVDNEPEEDDRITKCFVCDSMYVPENKCVECNEAFHMKCGASSDLPLCILCSSKKAKLSSESKQGFFRCFCFRGCHTKACRCIKSKIKCGSKCHKSISCKNK